MDSEEQSSSSSEGDEEEEDEDDDEEWLSSEERFDGRAADVKRLRWRTEGDVDRVPQTLSFLPARNPGPQLSPAHSLSPISLFMLFFSESAVADLCRHTNAQAAKALADGRKYGWTDVSVDELYRYFGLLLYMATVKMSSIADYWRKDSLFSVPFPASVMSRHRYHTISWNVHLSHPGEDVENEKRRATAEHDRLFKIKPLMDTMRLACRTFYHPRRSLTVKERLVPYGASAETTKAKPSNLGFRFFVLSDSSNGYTVDFSVYAGRNGRGLSYDAVMSLLVGKGLGSGYTVYMDDFHTSPKLLTDLFALKFGACGTYRDHRRGFPRNASNALTKASSRGSIRWIRDGPLLCVKWMDRKEVSVCSTVHAAYTGDRVQRKVKVQRKWRMEVFPCPAPVTAHNQHMLLADPSPPMLQYYTTQHKAIKWYRKVFLHFLDIAAYNAFVLYSELHGDTTYKDFLEQLIMELCGAARNQVPNQTNGGNHIPVPGAELSENIRFIATLGRRICVHCKVAYGRRTLTPWKCQACDVHLCLQLNRNCFKKWHKCT